MTLRGESSEAGLQFGGEAAAVVRIVEASVVQRPLRGVQGLREVAHRSEEKRDALLAGPDVGRLLLHLGHPHRVARGVEAIEGRRVQVELVAQHEHQGAQPAHVPPAGRAKLAR